MKESVERLRDTVVHLVMDFRLDYIEHQLKVLQDRLKKALAIGISTEEMKQMMEEIKTGRPCATPWHASWAAISYSFAPRRYAGSRPIALAPHALYCHTLYNNKERNNQMIIDKLKDLLQPANAAESEKANETPRLDQKALCQLLETTLASIGCTPTWEDERDQSRVASYEYQGGNFLVRIAKDDTFLRLCYPIFLSVDKELVELVREICNQVNLASIGLRAVYTFDEDHLHVNVHFFDNLYLEPRGPRKC